MKEVYLVDLTAPQIELSTGTIAMFWFSDKEVSASSEKQAKEKVEKMIKNINWKTMIQTDTDVQFNLNGIFCEIMDKDCCPLSNAEYKEVYESDIDMRPEICDLKLMEDPNEMEE